MSNLALDVNYNFWGKEEFDQCAEEQAGNWQEFNSFAWHRKYDLENPELWTIVYTENRDSDSLTRSNATVIDATMKRFFNVDSPYIMHEDHNHWAVGWVRGYAIRAYDKEGNVSKPFKAWLYIQYLIEQYPVLDEEHFSQLEYDECIDVVYNEGRRYVAENAPENWEYDVLGELMDMGYWIDSEFWPEEDDLIMALKNLELLDSSLEAQNG